MKRTLALTLALAAMAGYAAAGQVSFDEKGDMGAMVNEARQTAVAAAPAPGAALPH